jgi:hypothetical protein
MSGFRSPYPASHCGLTCAAPTNVATQKRQKALIVPHDAAADHGDIVGLRPCLPSPDDAQEHDPAQRVNVVEKLEARAAAGRAL